MSTLTNHTGHRIASLRRHLSHNASAWVVLALLLVLLGVGAYISDRFATVCNHAQRPPAGNGPCARRARADAWRF